MNHRVPLIINKEMKEDDHELESSGSSLALFSSDVVIIFAISRYRSTPTQLHISHSGTRFKGAEVR